MLELNKWFFAQLVNFLLLLFLLNIILFKPLLRIFKERDEGINGALNKAKDMDKEKDDLISQVDAKLAEGRARAKTVFEELSKQGMDVQKQALTTAQNEAVEMNKKAKQELESAVIKTRTTLKSDVEKFSKQIVEKLVGA